MSEGPLGRLALARSTVDTATARRSDDAWLAAAWADARRPACCASFAGRTLVAGDRLAPVAPHEAGAGERFLLGVDDDDVVWFAVLEEIEPEPSRRTATSPWRDCARSGRCSTTATPGCSSMPSPWRTGMRPIGRCARCGAADDGQGGRSRTAVPVLRHRALPAHRPGGDRAGHRRRRAGRCWATTRSGRRTGTRPWPASSSRGSPPSTPSSARSRRSRASTSSTCATSGASRGRSRPR